MKKTLTLFLQTLVVLTGVIIFVFMLWEPHLEGRNANATVSEVYFNDPFLAYAYAASILFFVALHQTFKVLGYAGNNNLSSSAAAKSLRAIKYCSLTLATTILGAEVWLITTMRGKDDIAGGVAMGLMLIVVCVAMATTAAIVEKRSAAQTPSLALH